MPLGLKLGCRTLCLYTLAILFTRSIYAQDITGSWQGTLAVPQGPPLRIVLKISRGENGVRNAKFCSIDQSADGYDADPIVVGDPYSRFVLRFPQASYEGQLRAASNSIDGTWIQGSRRALNLQRAPGHAWSTDAAHHIVQFVSVGPDVQLEVID